MSAKRPRSHGRLAEHQREEERKFLIQTVRSFNGSNTAMALWLGISRRALYDKMRDYGLTGEAAAARTEAGIMGPRISRTEAGRPGRPGSPLQEDRNP